MIRVFIDTKKFKGGPAVFRSRLMHFLGKEQDIELVYNSSDKFDIELSFIHTFFKHKKPRILRIDEEVLPKSQTGGGFDVSLIGKASISRAFWENFKKAKIILALMMEWCII